jgi:carbonic anhydrase
MSENFEGDKSSKNPSYVDYVCRNNVVATINEIRSASPILKEMEDKGEIKIVGGIYDLTDGKITLL